MPKIRGVKPDYWTDEDIVDLTIPARLLFIGLWNYACDNGHLQDKSKQIKMRLLPADDVNVAELLRELEEKGQIKRRGGWITIPNLSKHQRPDKRYWQTCDKAGCTRPPRNSEPETRGGHVGDTRGHDVVSMGPHVDGDGDGEVMVKGNTTGELALPDVIRDDVERICNHLADLVEANGSKRPTITVKWRDSARLMLDRDGRTEEEVHGAIEWCQSHEFWKGNILSLPKLREKFDQMRLQAQRRPSGRQAETDGIFERAAQRLGVSNGGIL